MYGFDQNTPETQGGNPIQAGINENVYLTKVAVEPSKEGSTTNVLAFHFEQSFERPDGESDVRSLRHAEFPIDVAETRERATKQGVDPDTFVKKRFEAQGIRIKHLVTKVVPKEKAVVKGDTFDKYATNVAALVTPFLKAPAGPFRLKVLLNNKNFSTLPPYVPFMEKQVEGYETNLVIGPKEKTKATSSSSLDMPGDSPDLGDDDLPF